MNDAFVIMQIGNKQLDAIYDGVLVPALQSCGLAPRRVDKHNNGQLLQSEIIRFITNSEIILADLTNERPNCYLEVGYAMGIDRLQSVLLMAREDHNPDSPNYVKTGPKVHFDLAGFDILYWHPDHLEDFKTELENRIRRRRREAPQQAISLFDTEWFTKHRNSANVLWEQKGLLDTFEICFSPNSSKTSKEYLELKQLAPLAAHGLSSSLIGQILGNVTYDGKPISNGLVNTLELQNENVFAYWALGKNCDLYFNCSLSEDSKWAQSKLKTPQKFLDGDSEITAFAEMLVFCWRLYSRLGIDDNSNIGVRIQYSGLTERRFVWNIDMPFHSHGKAIENEATGQVNVTLSQIHDHFANIIVDLAKPVFELFEVYELPLERIEAIVMRCLAKAPFSIS